MGSHRRLKRRAWLLLGAVCATATVSCRSEEPPPAPSAEDAPPQATSPDRVAPGALLEGEIVAFGFRAPQAMRLVARFHDAAHFEGRVKLADLEDYVRARVVARHVEVTPHRSVFPSARIRGGDAQRIYRFEIVPKAPALQLVIRDTTPPPPTEGLSEEERWRRAGLTPDGKLLDPNELE